MGRGYVGRQRHVLLDMHVPDWDARFLSRFDPKAFVDLCVDAGADAVMVYCNSHVGLCYWPTSSGRMHAGLGGRDVVAEQVALLHEGDIAVCAYYSGPVFNNWAYTEHPEWRIVAANPGGMAHEGSRYGVVCPNHPGCMDFMLAQVDELASAYHFDGFFFDMVFWTSVCVCVSCRDRYRREEGAEIPETVDWFSPEWCRFQAARERWLADAFRTLRAGVKAHRDVPVFLNGGIIKFDWWAGTGAELLRSNDLLGGDFHHRSVLPALARLTPSVVQYMKAISRYGGGASALLPMQEQLAHGFAATAFGGQFMAIDAVAADGSVSPSTYQRLSEVFAAIKPFEDFLGGTPIADIGIYLSQQSAVDFAHNGTKLDKLRVDMNQLSPHSAAVEGAIQALQEAHLPAGILTRDDLDRLDDVAVVVVPNALRLDQEEIENLRAYVARGGRLYASGYTSLVTSDGTRHDDFLLSDVFGCHFAGEELEAVTYITPVGAEASAWIAPLVYATHGEPSVGLPTFDKPRTAMRVSAEPDAHVFAVTTLPYRQGRGTRDDEDWASIHTSPPWQATAQPCVLRNGYGQGEAVYSSTTIESAGGASKASRDLFLGIIRHLLGRRPTF